MDQPDLLDQDPVFVFKGSMLATTILELTHLDLAKLDQQLAAKVAKAPEFFENIPLILATDKLAESEPLPNWPELLKVCHKHGLKIMALRASDPAQIDSAAAHLTLLPSSGAREKLIEPVTRQDAQPPVLKQVHAAQPEPQPPKPQHQPSKIVHQPVRGGQQIYAPGGDLIVLGPVSPGAELMADGNIHLYGPMRGRALAGVKGDLNAKIFCHRLTAELISIAGIYKVSEELRREPAWGDAAIISLSGEQLNITRL